jgi:hypothetical protein
MQVDDQIDASWEEPLYTWAKLDGCLAEQVLGMGCVSSFTSYFLHLSYLASERKTPIILDKNHSDLLPYFTLVPVEQEPPSRCMWLISRYALNKLACARTITRKRAPTTLACNLAILQRRPTNSTTTPTAHSRPSPPTHTQSPKWVAFAQRPSRSPPRSLLSDTTPSCRSTSRPTRGFAMR